MMGAAAATSEDRGSMRAAARFSLRTCPKCQARLPREDFSPCAAYCRPCLRAYNRDRSAKIKAGTWVPTGRDEYRRRSGGREIVVPIIRPTPPPIASVRPAPAPAPPPILNTEDALRVAMAALMRERGFTRLRATLVRLENELAKSKRDELAREGWIA